MNKTKSLFIAVIWFGLNTLAHAHFTQLTYMVDLGTFQPHQAQVWRINCPAGSASLYARIQDITKNKSIMNVTLFKDGAAQTAIDDNENDYSYGSAAAFLSAGAGTYYMIVTQTQNVISGYFILYYCQDANGVETTDDNDQAVLIQQ